MSDSPLPLEAFRAQAKSLGLTMAESELLELHAAHGDLALLLQRIHAHPGAAAEPWPESIAEAWEG